MKRTEFIMDGLDSGDRGIKILNDPDHGYVGRYPLNTRVILWVGLTSEDPRRSWASLTRREALTLAGALEAMANRLEDTGPRGNEDDTSG